jgi:hypothetical protein
MGLDGRRKTWLRKGVAHPAPTGKARMTVGGDLGFSRWLQRCPKARKRLEEALVNLSWSRPINSFAHSQELARRFNEEEAVWRCYERKRELRKLLGSRSPLPEETLDYLDWLEAERECRATRCSGKLVAPDAPVSSHP